jgi:hypothetical protein
VHLGIKVVVHDLLRPAHEGFYLLLREFNYLFWGHGQSQLEAGGPADKVQHWSNDLCLCSDTLFRYGAALRDIDL